MIEFWGANVVLKGNVNKIMSICFNKFVVGMNVCP